MPKSREACDFHFTSTIAYKHWFLFEELDILQQPSPPQHTNTNLITHTNMSGTTNTNPGNFANRPTEEVKAIASMGGKASHAGDREKAVDEKLSDEQLAEQGRRSDGTFLPGSNAASEAGHKGGLHSHDNDGKQEENAYEGRNADGTFTKGSEAAKEAGHKGGLAAAGKS